MAVQETTNVAAIATRACSPGHLQEPLHSSAMKVMDSVSTEENDVVTAVKKHKKIVGNLDMKENVQIIPNGQLKTATGKPVQSHKKITKNIKTENTDDLLDIYISDEVLKQLRSQKEEKENKHTKQIRRKQAKSQRKMMKILRMNNKEETDGIIQRQSKNIPEQTLRQKNSSSVNRCQFLEQNEMKVLEGSQDGNKAENNNWMVDNETSADVHNSLVLPNFHKRNNSAYDVDSIIESSDSMCRIGSLKDCTSLNSEAVQETIDLNTKKELERADSSDDSGCFSNLSVQSNSSPDSDRHGSQFDGYSENTLDESRVASGNKQNSTNSSGLCSVCGHEPHGHGSGMCKRCIGRIKHEGSRIGALGELRAYAQSIADSVKKILSISPRQSQEILHPFTSLESADENKKLTSQAEIANVTNTSGVQLQKCKTQIVMTHSEDGQAMSLNKSASFDGRMVPHLDDSCRGSPVYWISQDKPKVPISSSTLFEADEDRLRNTLDNASDHSVIDCDYFPSSGKEIKEYGGHDGGDSSSVVERARRKSCVKQISCVERMRPEGDTRRNDSQLITFHRKGTADEPRGLSDIHQSKNRIPCAENVRNNSQELEEEIKALNVFRLKVIHEGSPVDPLYTVQRGKGDDSKDRRAMLMRSATAPNKNHMPKKDITAMEDKSGLAKSMVRGRRINTKLELKTNKSLMPQIEETVLEDVQEKHQSNYEASLESWRDDNCATSVTPVNRRRSRSYDGRRTVSSKRSELHRSISRPPVDRDNKGVMLRRHATSRQAVSAKMNADNEGRYATKNEKTLSVVNYCMDGNHTDISTSIHSSTKTGTFADSYRFHALEPSNKELTYIFANDHISSIPDEEDNIQLHESSSKSYFNDDKFYCHNKECQLSTVPQEQILNKRNAKSTDSYYGHIDEFDSDSQLVDGSPVVGENVLKFESEDDRSMFKGGEEEDPYHKQIQIYSESSASLGKEGLWYNSQHEKRALFRRDRSHESKSSTSFHIVTPARSSHSDVALMKYQNGWDYVTSRRQTMYSETDVDTGLIYHLAKRQTTRAHVPAYHDLTSSSKDIYTMSGDVSTSASSNSAISTRSDVSESAYTGGFFKHDPFYDNDSTVSSCISTDSPVHLYFEPTSVTKREPSELDIYTGALFSSSQNALSLGRVAEDSITLPSDTLQDGSTNNSTRLPVSRMSRRLRQRPHIDIIKFKMTESIFEPLSKSVQLNNEILFTNISNNSSSWSETDSSKDSIYQGAVINKSKESSYTDYQSAMKNSFHVKTIEKTRPVLNIMAYDTPVSSSSTLFYTAPSVATASVGSDSMWYSGVSDNMGEESAFRQVSLPETNMGHVSYSWQRDDDYYRSSQRPIVNKTNNCSSYEESEQSSCNTNNNRFEDIYTGFFEASNNKASVQEQTNIKTRKTGSDNWYSEPSKRSYSPSDFYGEDASTSEAPKRTHSASYQSPEGIYSSASVFGQANVAYSGSRTYMTQSGWCDYDKMDTSSSNNYVDESPKFRYPSAESPSISEKYNYFKYASNQSPEESTYKYDKGAYSFDQRTPSPELDLNEIRKVGGIVCRENVVNKEDYAEDVNRDLEQGAWMPFNFRHEEKTRYQDETSNSRSEMITEILKAPVIVSNEKHQKHFEESSYNQDRIYDNVGARNKWREMKTKSQPSVAKKREPSPHKAHSAGDTKRQDHVKTGAWNPPDQIPDKARGKRSALTTPKPTVLEGSKGSRTALNVISSVTSIPSRLTNYVRRWF